MSHNTYVVHSTEACIQAFEFLQLHMPFLFWFHYNYIFRVLQLLNMRIPFCPLPVSRARVVAKRFYWISEPLVKISPRLKMELSQGGFPMDEREYMGIAVFSSMFMFFITFLPLAIVISSTSSVSKGIGIAFPSAAFLGFLSMIYIKKYPKLLIQRKVQDLERNMIFALRHFYVQIKSGVPVFDAMYSVAMGNYGSVSHEFKLAIRKINSGLPVEGVLEDMAFKNPSSYFRRTIWQISNGIKAGSDMGSLLKNIIENISSEQRIAIRRYGSQLNPLTLVYMMVAVVLPSLGVTFMLVMSSFSGLVVSETMFWMIIAFLALFQFMFLGIIKSKRPNII